MAEQLDVLERRVTERYVAAASARLPEDPFDLTKWVDSTPEQPAGDRKPELSTPTLQFPRQQWVTYPNKRIVALLIIDRALDHSDQLTDVHWAQLSFLMLYGGREQIA